MKKLITEQTVIEAHKKGEKVIYYDKGAIITQAASDRAQQLGVGIEMTVEGKTAKSASRVAVHEGEGEVIAIGSDHGGYQMKEALKPFLEGNGYIIIDVGTASEEACDYPDFAYAVGMTVSSGNAARGIMIDSIGTASAMVANKIPGIRAACCFNELSARSSREHNNCNVLTLGGKCLGIELAKAITKVWLESVFSGGRHQKRLTKITDIEKKLMK